jgi:trigger factor
VAAQFLLEEIARRTEIGVDQQELTDHIFRRAQQSGQDPNEFAKHMVEHNHIPEMVQEVLRGKALATIVDAARITDRSGAEVDLKNLRPDGSLGEPPDEEATEVDTESDTGDDTAAEAPQDATEGDTAEESPEKA